jgi:hypothetical protein
MRCLVTLCLRTLVAQVTEFWDGTEEYPEVVHRVISLLGPAPTRTA